MPVPAHSGRTQPVFLRFLQVNASAAAGTSRPGVLYFDSMAYAPGVCAHDEALAGCAPAAAYFRALLDNHFYWQATWQREGRLELSLPSRPSDTDGELLRRQAQHALVLDMISRVQDVWPRYGTAIGYEQPGIGANGFQDVFAASMMAALEWGLFDYARGVLVNWLEYYQRVDGTILYRGLEMPMQGRLLTILAAYYRYTADPSPLLTYLDRIGGVVRMLLRRRDAALASFPNVSDPRHGMPTGNDEADLWWCTTGGGKTELPFISIAAEAWRGLRDGGEVLGELATSVVLRKNATAARIARALASEMLKAAEGLLRDLRASVAASAIPEQRPARHMLRPGEQGEHPGNRTTSRTGRTTAVCHPYVAGSRTCGFLPGAPSSRDSESWRTYAEAMYSGALDAPTVREIYEWHRFARAERGGARLLLGVLTGSGIDNSAGAVLETFTLFGWGYGLLQSDLIEPFLLQYFAVAAHGYTRGTFIAPESSYVDRTQQSPSFATPAGLVAPLYLKWLLLFEDPITHTLWIAKALPRVWLHEGEAVVVTNASTAYGRLGFRIQSHITSCHRVHLNLTLPASWWQATRPGYPHSRPPPGGLKVRLRPPQANGSARIIRGATVGGLPWTAINTSEATLTIDTAALLKAGMRERLHDVWVSFSAS